MPYNNKTYQKWYAKNKERKLIYLKQYRIENRDILLAKKRVASKQYYIDHKEEKREYELNRYHSDIHFKLAYRLRRRLNLALHNNAKRGSAVKSLGCSIQQLKVYLEKQFQTGMSWENYGKWHLDHIIPLTLFNLTDPIQLSYAVHYTNLQPLWARENIIKSNKITT